MMSDSRGARAALGPGSMLGRFQILALVAAGGMGRVWIARQHGQRGFQKLVALKTALESLAENPEFEKYFLDEARVASRIHHPNVCAVLDLGEQDGALYLAMEWVAGGTLSEVIGASQERRLPPRIAARIFVQACAGLHAAHELVDDDGVPLGVVHRDVSPQNLLLTPEGHVKVADFGVVRAANQLHQATATGEIKGKISYMAPEQFTSKTFDRRVDVFSLGCTLYQATVGRKPFDDPNAPSSMTIYRILEGRFARPSELVPDFPGELEAIIVRALARQPDDRYPTMEAMRADLESYLATSGPPCTEVDVMKHIREVIGPAMARRATKVREAVTALDGDAAERSGSDPGSAKMAAAAAASASSPSRSAPSDPGPEAGAALSAAPAVEGARPKVSGAVYAAAVAVAIVAGGLAAVRQLPHGRASDTQAELPQELPAPAASASAFAANAATTPSGVSPVADEPAPPASSSAHLAASTPPRGSERVEGSARATRAGKPGASVSAPLKPAASSADTKPVSPVSVADPLATPVAPALAGGKPKRPIDVADPLRQ